MKKKIEKPRKLCLGLMHQIYLLLLVCLLILGVFTYYSQNRISMEDRIEDIQTFVGEVSAETIAAVKEYPAYRWLLCYWYDHADILDIEYDVEFTAGTVTEEKCILFSSRHPDVPLKYALEEEIEALPEEDQKLFAEIMYSWLTTRVNQIKHSYRADFLYSIVVDTEGGHAYDSQFFLFSGASPGAVRGTGYNEVYPLGKINSVEGNEILKNAMRTAVEEENSNGRKKFDYDDSGRYMDSYVLLDRMDSRAALVGMSFSLKNVVAEINAETWRGTWYAMLYQFLLLQIIMLHLFVFGIRPLKKVLENIRLFTKDKNSATVRENLTEALNGAKGLAIRHNEIGQLAEDFIDLTEEIDEYVERIETISDQKKRIEVELEVGAAIQAQMLPPPHPDNPENAMMDLYASMDPAREVGGDFYDYFMTDEDHLVLVIADVSNKGVPAALFMVIAKTLIKNRAQAGDSPAEILYHVNNQLCDGNEAGFFVTVWLAVIELSTGRGMAANAGHEHPALCRQGGRFELIRYRHSPAVGVIEELSFREHAFELHPGDRIFVYTDGVPEAVNCRNEMFGTDRMLEALNRDPQAPLEDILLRMKEEMDAFVGEVDQFDDITMICFNYTGPAEESGGTADEAAEPEA